MDYYSENPGLGPIASISFEWDHFRSNCAGLADDLHATTMADGQEGQGREEEEETPGVTPVRNEAP